MTRSSYITLSIVLLSLAPVLAAADISVNLKLDRSETRLTDSVQLTISVAGSRDSGSSPEIEGLEDFVVSSGGTSSRFEFINGKISSGMDYTFFIQPQKNRNLSDRSGPDTIKRPDLRQQHGHLARRQTGGK